MSSIDAVLGRINDLDSHEMIPANLWHENFGDAATQLAEYVTRDCTASQYAIHVAADDLAITPATVWQREGWKDEGPRGPSAIDMHRRLEVLDFMQVKRQQVFPGLGLFGLMVANCGPEYLAAAFHGQDGSHFDEAKLRRLGRAVMTEYNDWAVDKTSIDSDRLRMVAVIPTTNLDEMMAETERMLAGGIRSLFIAASVPPGGMSPADRQLDPFWNLCEEANASVVLHLAVENFMATDVWRQVPEFAQGSNTADEFVIDAWSFSTVHMAIENFLATVTLGGVFERHPALRMGAIECGSHWVGPMAENLDKWAKVFSRRMSSVLSMRPSEYLRRNLRVTPYIFEPIGDFMERYEQFGVPDILCYGSDFPHIEGGRDQITAYAQSLDRLNESMVEKFFVTNGELLMPVHS
jgi:predicted TIM-barrel fold metal-dependent hydrolase